MIAHPTTHSEARHVESAAMYRVHLWERPAPDYAWNLEAYIVEDALDAAEVIEWAQQRHPEGPIEIFIELDGPSMGPPADPRDAALIRIFGENPDA